MQPIKEAHGASIYLAHATPHFQPCTGTPTSTPTVAKLLTICGVSLEETIRPRATVGLYTPQMKKKQESMTEVVSHKRFRAETNLSHTHGSSSHQRLRPAII